MAAGRWHSLAHIGFRKCPLQCRKAGAALANDGTMTRPRTWLVLIAALSLSAGCADDGDGELGCEYDGELYRDGEQFPAGDGCNECVCNPDGATPGETRCSLLACIPPGTHPMCPSEPPIQACPLDCGPAACTGSCAEACGLTCAFCIEASPGVSDWVPYAIDCGCR